jgi:hypothetical protein
MAWLHREPASGNPQRQREAAAQRRDPLRGNRINAPTTCRSAQQVRSLVIRQHIKRDHPGTIMRHEIIKRASTADHDETRTGSRQQRPDLRRGPSVIKNNQNTLAVQQAPEQGSPLLITLRYLLARHTQCTQEAIKYQIR